MAQAIVGAMAINITVGVMGIMMGAAGKLGKWRMVATVTASVVLATVFSGATIASIIPKHIEFADVKVVGAYSERHPSTGFMRSTRHALVIQFPDGKTVELPSNIDAANMVGETIKVKVVENYLGGYNIYTSS